MPENNVTLSPCDAKAKEHAIIAYALMALGYFIGITWIVGAIWAYVKKDDAKGSIFHDHYSNMVSVFCWSLLWGIIGVLTAIFFIGYFILLASWIWSVFRIVKGLAKLTADKSFAG